jgi:ABC-type transporter Mla MlaB component
MATNVVPQKIEAGQLLPLLAAARRQFDNGAKEILLDFSSVRRIDANGLRATEEFIRLADEKAVKLTLRDVNVEVYKVLKLQKLAARVSYERT